MKLILWDWNGTLINDVDPCIDAMNVLLKKRNMTLMDRLTYRSIFTFPVIEYYKRLGFDLKRESFDVLANEYMVQFNIIEKQATLFPGTQTVLEYLSTTGYKQSILSAMSQPELLKQIERFGVLHYFDDIIGLQNIFAESKIYNAINYIRNGKFHKNDIIIIGDTCHDYEVSKCIGCKCILVSNGHQNLNQSIVPGALLLNNISEICNRIK